MKAMARDLIVYLAKEVTAQTEAIEPNIVRLKEF